MCVYGVVNRMLLLYIKLYDDDVKWGRKGMVDRRKREREREKFVQHVQNIYIQPK